MKFKSTPKNRTICTLLTVCLFSSTSSVFPVMLLRIFIIPTKTPLIIQPQISITSITLPVRTPQQAGTTEFMLKDVLLHPMLCF